MFSRNTRGVNVFHMYMKVLKDSRVLSTTDHPDPSKPAWTKARASEIYSTLSPKNLKELKAWWEENEMNESDGGELSAAAKVDEMKRRQEIEALVRAERKAYLLTQPTYVTSYFHWYATNAQRLPSEVKRGGDSEANRQKFIKLRKLFESEKENFQMQQLAKLAQRRIAAEAWAKRAQEGLDEVNAAETKSG